MEFSELILMGKSICESHPSGCYDCPLRDYEYCDTSFSEFLTCGTGNLEEDIKRIYERNTSQKEVQK